jgi:hypothetical protein
MQETIKQFEKLNVWFLIFFLNFRF